MTIEVKVPQLPESVADATLLSWHKGPGDAVERDENLVDLETDKVVLEVPSPVAGVLSEIKAEDGTTVTSGELLALIEEGAAPAAKPQQKADDEATAEAGAENEASRQPAEADSGTADTGKGGDAAETGDRHKLSPSVRRLVEEHGLEAAEIAGTGKHGRLTKADVMSHIEGRKKDAPTPPPTAPGGAPPPAAGAREERRVAMTRMRARIAERLVEVQQTAAILTSFNEVDLHEVMRLRSEYKERFEKAHGVRLGFMSFFVKAAIEGLRRFPVVNASIDGDEIVYHDYCDVGIAVSTERGLMVPILRNAEAMSLAEIETTIMDYATRARDGKIGLDELTGGTFSITNGGVFGSLMSTPIINPPQSAILGMHKIQERPMVVGGEIEVRPMMYIALSYDHRIIDGREAVQFLVTVKERLEDPARLLLQV
jgi:2-oxoglutarate dehydrogenase E2 component (dihydrolipoamide succinyltransferase)